jgi:hypothetical protein
MHGCGDQRVGGAHDRTVRADEPVLGGSRRRGEHQRLERRVIDGPAERQLGVHEERLAKRAVAEEVQVLLAHHDIGRQRSDQLAHAVRHVSELAVGQIGLGQELQAGGGRVLHELVKVERRADGREVVVVEQRVGAVEHPLQLLAQHPGVRSCGVHRDDGSHEVLGVGEPLGRGLDLLKVVGQDVARHVAQVGARVGVVAHERDPLRRQHPPRELQQRAAGGRRDPRVHAVGDHVVDGAKPRQRLDLAELVRPQLDVPKPCRRGQRPPPGDRRCRRVHAHDDGAGQRLGDRQRIGPVPAAELQHPAPGGRGRVQPKQPTERLEPRRVRLRIGVPRVGNLLIGRRGARRRGQGVLVAVRSHPVLLTWFHPVEILF